MRGDVLELLMSLVGRGQSEPPPPPRPQPSQESQYAHKFSLSEGVESARKRMGISVGTIAEMIPRWRELQQGEGNSANFQRELYEAWSGRAAPENYTGFHAGQIDRIGNVISPESADIGLMREIAVIASALRELDSTGYNNDFQAQFGGWR